jgi:hypothetical protein
MKAEITLNGQTEAINIAKTLQTGAEKQLRAFVKAKGIDWVDAEFFIANFPERGRYFQKSKGFQTIQAGG